jgi:hypothetical protein
MELRWYTDSYLAVFLSMGAGGNLMLLVTGESVKVEGK